MRQLATAARASRGRARRAATFLRVLATLDARRDVSVVVLRRLLAERLRLRISKGEAGRNARALQGEEHGRRAVGARGVPGDVWNVPVSRTN